MNQSRLMMAAAVLAAATALACSKKTAGGTAAGGGGNAATHVSGTPHTDDVIGAWKGAGLTPEGFAVPQPIPYGASYCEEGRIQGVDALVCEFADDATLDRGQKLLQDEWGRAGIHTGVALRTKRTLLAVVDRGLHDPNGKTISQLVKAFRKL